MDIFEKCYQRYIQDEVREQGVYPYFRALESRQDTEVIMEGKRRIMLGSNNYLGLTTNSSVIEAGVQAYRTLGSGCSGSRFLNGTLKLHLELEDELAKFLRKDAVVTFSTGFQSNLGIISSIVGLHDYVIMDRENHASLYDGCKLSYGKMLRYQHNDMADLEKKLQKVPDTAGCLIVTDGVFSMGGDIANLPEICALAQKYGARVMVDDAHGLGVIGEGGRGTASSRVADFVRHSSRPFIFSASIPPANTAAALAALRELEAHPELVTTLQENAKYMRGLLNERNIKMRPSNGDCIPIIPIYTYEPLPTLTIAKELYEGGVYVNSSLPPAAAPHECLLRTSLMATHTHALIDEAVGVIAEVLRRYAL